MHYRLFRRSLVEGPLSFNFLAIMNVHIRTLYGFKFPYLLGKYLEEGLIGHNGKSTFNRI